MNAAYTYFRRIPKRARSRPFAPGMAAWNCTCTRTWIRSDRSDRRPRHRTRWRWLTRTRETVAWRAPDIVAAVTNDAEKTTGRTRSARRRDGNRFFSFYSKTTKRVRLPISILSQRDSGRAVRETRERSDGGRKANELVSKMLTTAGCETRTAEISRTTPRLINDRVSHIDTLLVTGHVLDAPTCPFVVMPSHRKRRRRPPPSHRSKSYHQWISVDRCDVHYHRHRCDNALLIVSDNRAATVTAVDHNQSSVYFILNAATTKFNFNDKP